VSGIKRQRLFKRIGYSFKDEKLVDLALTHRSFASLNNERLEFLGDSILNFTIAEALYRQYPQAKEGQLSRLRAQLVKGETLAEVAREFDLGDHLILGEGELKSGGHRRDSILSDTVEALIGAIYIEGGMDICQERVLAWYKSRLALHQLEFTEKDPKTQLQEFLQARRAPLPEYAVIDVTGVAHEQVFTVECRVSLLSKPTSAKATSRRAAEKLSASQALKKLQS
jgi:ribonuclease III